MLVIQLSEDMRLVSLPTVGKQKRPSYALERRDPKAHPRSKYAWNATTVLYGQAAEWLAETYFGPITTDNITRVYDITEKGHMDSAHF